MRVTFDDSNDNWEKWGTLVQSWILGTNVTPRPNNTGELARQMRAQGITGVIIPGALRPVSIVDYLDNGPLYINLPSARMLAAKEAMIPPGPGPYPPPVLPLFYDVAYAGAARAILSQAEKDAFKLRRIGEYTINECC